MTKYRFAGRRVASALLVLALVSLPVGAQVTLNLKDADISTLIATVSEVTGKNFIVDPRVKGKVTVISASPMDAAGVYETFLAVLQVQGFAAIPSGDTVKIVPETNAKSDGGGYDSNGRGIARDEIVTHVYEVQNISAAQLAPLLRPLVPQWGLLAAYAPSNMLIISDRAANVQRIEKLIRQIDQSGDRDIDMVQLKHAGAAEVVRIITSLTQADKQVDPTSKPALVIADERSNSVLLGGDKTERQKLLDIVKRLDIPVGEDGATQVIYLRFASAENLSPILEGYAQQVASSDQKAPAAGAAPSPSSGGGSNGVRVLADKDTNALVITAPPKAMRAVRDVIAQLDIRRAQVLVEAIVAEVGEDRSGQLGIDWAVFNNGNIAAAGILNPNTLQLANTVAASAITGSAGTAAASAAGNVLTSGITTVAGRISQTGTSFALLLNALRGDGNSNVLSAPTLVTMDNEEAEFSVGQEVPFLTGSFSNSGSSSTNGSVNPFQTIQRKDVGLTLGITPQINEGDSLKLKIKLEVSSLASGSTGAVDLVTNKRTLSNTVGVDNGQILVLGGLIDDQVQDTKRSVPFLGDIPLLGSLFRYRSISKQKRNLMVFLKPGIIRKASDGDYYTQRKYEQIRALQIDAMPGAVPLIGGKKSVLDTYERFLSQRPPADPPPVQSGDAPVIGGAEAGAAAPPAAAAGPAGAAAPEPTPAPVPAPAPQP